MNSVLASTTPRKMFIAVWVLSVSILGQTIEQANSAPPLLDGEVVGRCAWPPTVAHPTGRALARGAPGQHPLWAPHAQPQTRPADALTAACTIPPICLIPY